jgi:GTP cyclohydrolase I
MNSSLGNKTRLELFFKVFLRVNNLKGPDFDDTPERVTRFWLEFLNPEPPKIKAFPSEATDYVKLNGYQTWGMCPHHLLPVRYTVSISYIPNGQVFGISKLPRVVDYTLSKLPLQEDLPRLIIEYLKEHLDITSATCTVKGLHLCMVMRGIKARDCTLTTSHSYTRGR